MVLLAAPVTSLVAGFFVDEISELVERQIDPNALPGRPIPLWPSIVMGIRFGVLSLLVSIVVLALTLFTGIGFLSFFVLNGYLLGGNISTSRRCGTFRKETRDLCARTTWSPFSWPASLSLVSSRFRF